MFTNLSCSKEDPIIIRMRENGFNPNRLRPFAEKTVGGNFKIWLALSENEVVAAPEGYRLNAVLTVDAWKRIDEVVAKVLRTELVLFQDVLDRGLTQPLGSTDQALATMFYLYQKASDPGEVKILILDPLPTERVPLTVVTSETTEPKVTAPVPFKVRLLKFEVPLMVWAPPPNIIVP